MVTEQSTETDPTDQKTNRSTDPDAAEIKSVALKSSKQVVNNKACHEQAATTAANSVPRKTVVKVDAGVINSPYLLLSGKKRKAPLSSDESPPEDAPLRLQNTPGAHKRICTNNDEIDLTSSVKKLLIRSFSIEMQDAQPSIVTTSASKRTSRRSARKPAGRTDAADQKSTSRFSSSESPLKPNPSVLLEAKEDKGTDYCKEVVAITSKAVETGHTVTETESRSHSQAEVSKEFLSNTTCSPNNSFVNLSGDNPLVPLQLDFFKGLFQNEEADEETKESAIIPPPAQEYQGALKIVKPKALKGHGFSNCLPFTSPVNAQLRCNETYENSFFENFAHKDSPFAFNTPGFGIPVMKSSPALMNLNSHGKVNSQGKASGASGNSVPSFEDPFAADFQYDQEHGGDAHFDQYFYEIEGKECGFSPSLPKKVTLCFRIKTRDKANTIDKECTFQAPLMIEKEIVSTDVESSGSPSDKKENIPSKVENVSKSGKKKEDSTISQVLSKKIDDNPGSNGFCSHLLRDQWLRSESEYLPDPKMFEHHEYSGLHRQVLIQWMMELCYEDEFHRSTFYSALNYLDRFFSKTQDVPPEFYQVLATVSLFIAGKKEEVVPPTVPKMILMCCESQLKPQQYRAIELKMMEVLEWKLAPTTYFDWMSLYLIIAAEESRLFRSVVKEDVKQMSRRPKLHHPALTKFQCELPIFLDCMNLIDRYIYYTCSLEDSMSMACAAAFCSVMDNMFSKELSEKSRDELLFKVTKYRRLDILITLGYMNELLLKKNFFPEPQYKNFFYPEDELKQPFYNDMCSYLNNCGLCDVEVRVEDEDSIQSLGAFDSVRQDAATEA